MLFNKYTNIHSMNTRVPVCKHTCACQLMHMLMSKNKNGHPENNYYR